ncbi:MAG: iron chelate uptake ABC transporter family permease subunit [Phycisphaerales bacterium]
MSTTGSQPGLVREAVEVLTFQAGYNTNAVLAGSAMRGLAAGVVGVLALLRRRSLVADAIGHATLPGVVAAFLVAVALGGTGRSLPVLLLGAAINGMAAVGCIFAILRYTRLREDAAIGIVLGVFFGVGVVMLSYVQDPANTGGASPAGLHHFIYGQTAAMRAGDAMFMAVLAVVAVAVVLTLFKELALGAFNADFARVLGYHVGVLDAIVLGLIVLVTVAGLQAVGLILVVALLVIPPVTARLWPDRLVPLVFIAGVVGLCTGFVGAAVSAVLPRTPAGSVIVLCGGAVFVLSLLVAPRHGAIATAGRRIAQRLRIAGDHFLEAAYEHRVSRRGETAIPQRTVDAMQRLWGWPVWMRPLVLGGLQRRGLMRRTEAGFELTEPGIASGARIARNHRLWEQYLLRYADIAPGHVDWSTDMVEHVLSPELVAELEAALADGGSENT